MSLSFCASSAIVTRKSDQRVFIGRRKHTKSSWPGLWEMIGGGVENNETPEECLRREIEEELCAEVQAMYPFRDYMTGNGLVRVFIVSLMSEPRPNDEDFEEGCWVSVEEVREREFASNCKDRLLDYFEYCLSLK